MINGCGYKDFRKNKFYFQEYKLIASVKVSGQDNAVRVKIDYTVSPSNFGSSITLEFDLSTGISSEIEG